MRRAPSDSGFRLPEAVKIRVEPKLAKLEAAEGLSRRIVLNDVRYELRLLDPEQAARHKQVKAFAAFAKADATRRRRQASARRILDSAVPTLQEMRRFLRGAPKRLDAHVIDALLDIPKAKMIEAALNESEPFKWTESSVGELRAAKSATRWLDGELGNRAKMTAGQFHEFTYRGSVWHRAPR